MINTLAQLAIMIEEVCPALELHYRVMSGPAQNRLQNPATVRERAKRIVAGTIAQKVGVSSRVREIVFTVVLVHPGSLEEATVMVVTENGFARLRGENGDLLDFTIELKHVLSELSSPRSLRGNTLSANLLGTLPFRIENIVAFLVTLKLSAPKTPEVEVCATVLIDEAGRVDAVAALDGLGFGGEGPLGLVADGNADTEDALLVACREVKVVFAVLLGTVGGPKLFGDPWDVLSF